LSRAGFRNNLANPKIVPGFMSELEKPTQRSIEMPAPESHSRIALLIRLVTVFASLCVLSYGQSQTRTVSIGSNFFKDAVSNNSTSTINVGDKIHWTWVSGLHSTTSGNCSQSTSECTPNGQWDSGEGSGLTFDRTFNSVGTFPYFCSIHGIMMRGTVIVQAATTAATTTTLATSGSPSAVGEEVIFTATVTSGAGTPAGNVTFKTDGVDLGAPVALNGAGVATISTSALTAGTHSITAFYGGNASFSASEALAVSQVVKANTTTVIETSGSPSAVGQSVTFTAIVTSGAGTPAGNVTFTSDGADLGAPVALSGAGIAVMNTSALTAGTHSIVASYSGNPNFSGSSSSGLSQAVKINTTTSVQSSLNPSTAQEAVVFTATVNNSGAVATGTISFRDNGLEIGSGSLNPSGVATFQTDALGEGDHPINAVYGGDSTHFSSSSSPVVQTVNPSASLHFSVSVLNFGQVTIFRKSGPKSVILTNGTAESVSTASLQASGDFSQTHNCPSTLVPTASCTINLTLTPAAIGERSGLLSLSGANSVSLTGLGIEFTFSLTRPIRPPRPQ
jgi:plastocyanin